MSLLTSRANGRHHIIFSLPGLGKYGNVGYVWVRE